MGHLQKKDIIISSEKTYIEAFISRTEISKGKKINENGFYLTFGVQQVSYVIFSL